MFKKVEIPEGLLASLIEVLKGFTGMQTQCDPAGSTKIVYPLGEGFLRHQTEAQQLLKQVTKYVAIKEEIARDEVRNNPRTPPPSSPAARIVPKDKANWNDYLKKFKL